jgi:hypothetical protein
MPVLMNRDLLQTEARTNREERHRMPLMTNAMGSSAEDGPHTCSTRRSPCDTEIL